MGWIDSAASPLKLVLVVLAQLALAFLIWLGFMVYYRREAKAINARIKARE